MTDIDSKRPDHAKGLVSVTGSLHSVNAKNRSRLAVFLIQRDTVLSESPVSASGTFQVHITRELASAPGVTAVLGPKGMDGQSLSTRTDLPHMALAQAHDPENARLNLNFDISDKIIDLWWIWCREYTVSGTLETSNECPIGAAVTIYNVTSGVSGLIKTPITTVPTDASGFYTATFNWCSRECWWPCWRLWWRCWPWWWELDILAVIENLERHLRVQNFATAANLAAHAPIRQPAAEDLMVGAGFAVNRAGMELKPDSARTALIASKFADLRIREIFPWWWWCCENPNLVFSATQGANVVLNEDPNTSTRWCFASGQNVALTGNSLSVGGCSTGTGDGECAFGWSSVGNMPGGTLVTEITDGYANGGGACSNLAFAGNLNLNGTFGGDCIAYYQVLAGQWGGNGNPARGGTAPMAYPALALPGQQVNWVSIWREATLSVEIDQVVMGPFSFNGQSNLYVTPQARQSLALDPLIIAQIGAFPTVAGADFVIGWDAPDIVLSVPASELIAPATANGVTLVLQPYDATATAIPPADVHMGANLTLMIDTTPLSIATVDSVTVYNDDNTPATQTMLGDCPAYLITTPGGGYAKIHTVVVDANGHLCEYRINTQYGHGTSVLGLPADRDYAQSVSSFTTVSATSPYAVDGGYSVPNTTPAPVGSIPAWDYVGGGDTFQFPITQSCCYDFQLLVAKRTTDGTNSCIEGTADFQTVNITVA